MFKNIIDKLTSFAETKLSVMKLTFIEKVAVIMAFCMLMMFVAFCLLTILIILGVGLSFYFGEVSGSIVTGFFITAGIYSVLLILSFLFKKPLLRFFAGMFINQMTSDDIEHSIKQ